jgi:hypothetical protein
MAMLAEPIAAGQVQEQRPVEATRLAEGDILGGGGLAVRVRASTAFADTPWPYGRPAHRESSVSGGENPRINGAHRSLGSQLKPLSARPLAGAVSDRGTARSTNWRQAHPVGDRIAATTTSNDPPSGDRDGRLCLHCSGARRFGLSAGGQTLIRHAAASGAVRAAPIGMHPAPAIGRLVSAARFPLVAAPDFQSTIRTTVYLATIASPTDNDLLATSAANK